MIDELIFLNTKTNWRDKLAKLVQFGSRLSWYVLQQNPSVSSKTINRLKTLEFTSSLFRKSLRFGTFLDCSYGALKCVKHDNNLSQVLLTMSKFSYSLFLFCDHILWFARTGLADFNIEKWTKTADKFWLYSVVLNLTRNFLELRACCNFKVNISTQIFMVYRSQKLLFLDIIKNFCDMFIPLNSLGVTKFTPGTTGLLGVLSSLISLMTLVENVFTFGL